MQIRPSSFQRSQRHHNADRPLSFDKRGVEFLNPAFFLDSAVCSGVMCARPFCLWLLSAPADAGADSVECRLVFGVANCGRDERHHQDVFAIHQVDLVARGVDRLILCVAHPLDVQRQLSCVHPIDLGSFTCIDHRDVLDGVHLRRKDWDEK